MVGFQPGSYDNLGKTDYVIAGAASGFITRAMFQPMDVLKIRFQLQIEPVKHSCTHAKYKGMLHAVRCILREEGIAALWKGHVPAQCLSVAYGALQFLSFELLTKHAWNLFPADIHSSLKPVIHFSCGALSGCVATVGSLPFDVIRTRLVGQGEPKIYRGVFHASVMMMTKEGPRSFYKGLVPTLLQIAPNAGAQFAFYRMFLDAWNFIFKTNTSNSGILQLSLCGAGAGIAAKTVVYPLDLVKKRIQVQGFEKAREFFGAVRCYKGLIDCFKSVIREEGFLGLYKGLSPSILKAACTTGSHFLFYEEVCRLLRFIHS